MINTGDLEKILATTFATGWIKNEQPLSLLIIAKVGFGKSALVARFALNDGIFYTNDSTVYSLHKLHGEDLKTGKIKHIVIPDLLNALNKQKEQAGAFITFMNSLIEEGISRVESRDSHFSINYPVRVGLVTCIAAQDYIKRRDQWSAVGFLSRLLPIRFRYSKSTIEAILDSIVLRQYHGDRPTRLNFSKFMEIDLPVKIGNDIKQIAKVTKDPEDELAGRRLKQLQVFSMGLAMLAGRDQVNRDDLIELARLSPFMRPPQYINVTRGKVQVVLENTDSYKEI